MSDGAYQGWEMELRAEKRRQREAELPDFDPETPQALRDLEDGIRRYLLARSEYLGTEPGSSDGRAARNRLDSRREELGIDLNYALKKLRQAF